MDFTADIQTEKIQREVLKILYDNLNTEITNRSAGWTAADNAFYSSIGRANPGFTVELIAAENFYPGVVPSLIEAPIDKYPNVSVYAWAATPLNTNDDTGEEYRITVSIEVMVKSDDSELEANSRIQKTMEAVHAVLVKEPTFNGKVNSVNAPILTLGDVFVRREKAGTGPRFLWQGGKLDYVAEKYGKMF